MPFSLYLSVHVRDFAAQALIGAHLELRSQAVAALGGDPPLEYVFAMNQRARLLGVELGMNRVQAESFPVTLLCRNRQQEDAAFAELMNCAQRFSPRIEIIDSPKEQTCGATLVLDVSGSERLLGNAQQITRKIQQAIHSTGYEASVAVSHNAYAAVLLSRGHEGAATIPNGCEAEALAPLPLSVLELDDVQADTFASWGIRTLKQMAALPTKALVSRVGESGLRLQALARGEYRHLLVPEQDPADAPLYESTELEHPVELLEPLFFLLSRMLEQIAQRAAQRALAIASVETCLVLDNEERGEHRRTVRPALPERNHHTLLKLIQLDLEVHPPEAPVMALRVAAQPARPQTAQQGLFAAQAPEAGRLEVLLARLRKLVGEERVGAPELLDTHVPDAFRIATFTAQAEDARTPQRSHLRASALRMMRPPLAVHITTNRSQPATLFMEGERLTVATCSGPWRTSGAWWTHPEWCREEWDIELAERQRRCLRLAYDPGANCWYVIGTYD